MAEKTTTVDNAQEKDELVLEDNQLVCALTNKVVWKIQCTLPPCARQN